MNNILKRMGQWPYYLFLFPAFFVFHGFVENHPFVPVLHTFLLWAKYIAAILIIRLLLYLLYKDFTRASLMAAFVMAFQFFFGNIQDLLRSLSPGSFLTKYSFLVPAFLVIAAVLFFIIKKRKSLSTVTSYLNILFIILIVIDLVSLVSQTIKKPGTDSRTAAGTFSICNNCPKPDVYIIMLDEYAGAGELRDIFGFNNQPFFDTLAQRGFKTVANSHSNYNYTPYSTAATLNMQYMDSQKTKNVKRGYKYAINDINQNNTVKFFVNSGYKFHNYSSFTVGDQPAATEGSFVPVGTKLISASTFLTRFEKDVWVNIATKYNFNWYLEKSMYVTLKDNEHVYQLTKKIAETKGYPKIVYTHLLLPHYPYYYNETGELRSFDSLRKSNLNNKEHYLSYLKYTNRQITALVDHIRSHSTAPPVIALISDHGYRHYKDNPDLNYYFSNLISVHLPSRNYDKITDSVSNVNFFRLLLNSEFRQELPLLEDKKFLIDF